MRFAFFLFEKKNLHKFIEDFFPDLGKEYRVKVYTGLNTKFVFFEKQILDFKYL